MDNSMSLFDSKKDTYLFLDTYLILNTYLNFDTITSVSIYVRLKWTGKFLDLSIIHFR